MNEVRSYPVWDATVRWFHWINVLCVIGLIAVGVVILNAKALGIPSDGKILLKTVHVWIGYVFALNLLWRLVWAFIGGPFARWRAILPGGRGYLTEVRDYARNFGRDDVRPYLGHNPIGRLAVTVLLLTLSVQAITGLVLAGTDIFYPPLGSWIASWIAAPGVDPATLLPYAKDTYDPASYEAMRAFRKPFITVHYWGFYVITGLVIVHILAVVVTEVKEQHGLVSAMFSGKKLLERKPLDMED